MSMVRYGHPMMHLQQINRIFDQFDSDLFGRLENLGEGMFAPAVDVKEDADAYTVHLEVPGVSQDNINLTLQDNILTIAGTKEQKQESAASRYRRVERTYGSFSRSISLPRGVDGNAVTANLEDGVLEVRLPKREEVRPRQINIGVTRNALEALGASNTSSESQPQANVPLQATAPAQADAPLQNVSPVQTKDNAHDANADANGGASEDARVRNPI